MSENDKIFEEVRKHAGVKTEEEKEKEIERVRLQDEKNNRTINRIAEVRKNPDKLFWQLGLCGAGVQIIFQGLLDVRVNVPRDPEYMSVDAMIQRIFNGISGNDPAAPINRLTEDSVFGDSLRNSVFEAYKYAYSVYKWCDKNKCSYMDFPRKMNPKFLTMNDNEVKEFFEAQKAKKE